MPLTSEELERVNRDGFPGTVRPVDAPYWKPLLMAVGLARRHQFMLMFAVDLRLESETPKVIYAYKHTNGRRYLYLSDDGWAYRYTAAGGYLPVSWWDALAHVYEGQPEAYRAARG